MREKIKNYFQKCKQKQTRFYVILVASKVTGQKFSLSMSFKKEIIKNSLNKCNQAANIVNKIEKKTVKLKSFCISREGEWETEN